MPRLTQAALWIGLALAARVAAADSPSGDRLERIRKAYELRDYETVRSELLAAYDAQPEPQLLFALGQVELNLGNYQAAISYYERFIATGPSDDQVALAQQAIGAARMRLAAPEPTVSSPPVAEPMPALVEAPVAERPREPRRRWHTEDTGLVALGSAAVLVGGGLLVYSGVLGNDTSGSLSEYDARLDQARMTRWTGAGVAAAGALVIGVTVLRWRW